MNTEKPCPRCGGNGEEPGVPMSLEAERPVCSKCGGIGKLPMKAEKKAGTMDPSEMETVMDVMRSQTCLRCGHKWYPRTPKSPTVCPKCKSPYWNRRRKYRLKRLGVVQQHFAE